MLQVTPEQSISIFGFFDQPRTIVCWEDLTKNNWSWRKLRQELNFTPQQLQKIQPDKQAWITRGSLTLHDLAEMTIFPINPFTDMQADLGEVWSMKWPHNVLADMQVTYDQLKSRGLSPSIMQHFNFSLSAWYTLGFKKHHVHDMQTPDTMLVFGMSKDELMHIMVDFEAK
mgnify:CR=1 FL=1|tara:strand:+ start:4926 stop:5438 length:513 start_codon:yes stop_codon:yes gene_type:complete